MYDLNMPPRQKVSIEFEYKPVSLTLQSVWVSLVEESRIDSITKSAVAGDTEARGSCSTIVL